MQKSLLPLLLLGAAVLPGTATAAGQAPATVTVSERISYADLDLASPQGVATLDRRIGSAVRRLCGTGPAALIEQFERRRCRHEARSGVFPQRALAIAAARRGDGPVRVAVVRR